MAALGPLPPPTVVEQHIRQVVKHNGGDVNLQTLNNAYFNGQIPINAMEAIARNLGLQQVGSYDWIDPQIKSASMGGLGSLMTPVMSIGTMTYGTGAPPVAKVRPPQGMPHQDPKRNRRKFQINDIVEIIGNESDQTHHFAIGSIGKIVDYNSPYYAVLQEEEHQYIQAKNLKLYVPKPKVALASVVISDAKKEEIQAAISQVKNDEQIFTEWGFSDVFEKGTAVSLLFWGIPGTGKTLTAQAIADETDGELKIYGTAEIQSSEPGGAERMIQQIFAEAKRQNDGGGKRRIILFDECDSLLMDRNEVGPILGAMVNALLTEIEKYEGIVIFTTNRMGKLDPALERRLTSKIEFEFPDKKARRAIWERMIPKKAPIAKNVNLDKLAEYPLAGGNIKNSVLNAARLASYRKEKEIKMEHFIDAIEKEARALQAFISEYEKQSHSSMLGHINHDASGSVVVDKKAVAKTTMNVREKISMKGVLGKKK